MSKEFLPQYDNSKLMIVDALNLAFRYKHSGAKHFLDDYMKTVSSLRKSYQCGKVVIACDMGSSTYRKNIYPGYKKARKDKFDNQTEQEKEDFAEFFQEFSETINMYIVKKDIPVLRFQGCEADDIAAYIVSKRNKLGLEHIWLMSSDKDWDLLIKKNVSRFSYVTRKEITYDNWNDYYEFPQSSYIDIKCLAGDTGDSVPGVNSIGPKKAAALVSQYGSLLDIMDALPIESKYKHIQKLNEFGKDNLELNLKLMDLVSYSAEALGVENTKIIDEVLHEYL